MDPPIKEVVITIDGRHGGKFSVVQFENGEYGITRDGEMLTRCGPNLKECLRSLQSLSGMGSGDKA